MPAGQRGVPAAAVQRTGAAKGGGREGDGGGYGNSSTKAASSGTAAEAAAAAAKSRAGGGGAAAVIVGVEGERMPHEGGGYGGDRGGRAVGRGEGEAVAAAGEGATKIVSESTMRGGVAAEEAGTSRTAAGASKPGGSRAAPPAAATLEGGGQSEIRGRAAASVSHQRAASNSRRSASLKRSSPHSGLANAADAFAVGGHSPARHSNIGGQQPRGGPAVGAVVGQPQQQQQWQAETSRVTPIAAANAQGGRGQQLDRSSFHRSSAAEEYPTPRKPFRPPGSRFRNIGGDAGTPTTTSPAPTAAAGGSRPDGGYGGGGSSSAILAAASAFAAAGATTSTASSTTAAAAEAAEVSACLPSGHSSSGVGESSKGPRVQSYDGMREPQAAAARAEKTSVLARSNWKQGRRQVVGGGVGGCHSGPACVDKFNLSTYGLHTIEHALDDGYETQAAYTATDSKRSWLLGGWKQKQMSSASTMPTTADQQQQKQQQQEEEQVSQDSSNRGGVADAGCGSSRKTSPAVAAAGGRGGGFFAGRGAESSGSNSLGGGGDARRISPERDKRVLPARQQQLQYHRSGASVAETAAAAGQRVAAERQKQQRHSEWKAAAGTGMGGRRRHAAGEEAEEGDAAAAEAAAAATAAANYPWVVRWKDGVWEREQLPAATSCGDGGDDSSSSTHRGRGSTSCSRSRGRSSSVNRRSSRKRSSSTDNNNNPRYREASRHTGRPKGVLSVYELLKRRKETAGPASKERPSAHTNNQLRGAMPIRVFCGTWNCEYQDLPVSTMVESSPGAVYENSVELPQQLPEHLVEELLEDEDAWATAAEEGEEKGDDGTIHPRVAASSFSSPSPPRSSLNFGSSTRSPGAPAAAAAGHAAAPTAAQAAAAGPGASVSSSSAAAAGRPGEAVPAGGAPGSRPSPQAHAAAAAASPPRMVARGSLQRRSTLSLRAVRQGEEPLRQWVLPGYDVYVITLQETISDSVFHAITVFLRKENGRPYRRLQATEDRISGLGDGAWTQFKSTSIAAWVREDYMHPRGPIELVGSKAVPLSFFNGSKGAVSVLLKLWDQHTCFLGCHMPASSTEDRVRARVWILGRLCEWYGGMPNATLDAVFHHVVWMGDFNFRTRHIAAAAAVKMLEEGRLAELLQHDECFCSEGRDLRQAGFKEARITFPPTYKKADGRPPANVEDRHWPAKEYQTKYTVKWYKGRHQEDRIPSWTDRVFKWSLPELRSLLRVQNGMYYASMPEEPSHFLNASDHSPVACCMECFPLDPFYSVPPVFSVAACASQQAPS